MAAAACFLAGFQWKTAWRERRKWWERERLQIVGLYEKNLEEFKKLEPYSVRAD